MIFGQDRNELRLMYVESWRKSQSRESLTPLEAQIAAVIEMHPEYQDMMDKERIDDTFMPEVGQANPFLHMGLHLAVREQLSTDRPSGIRDIFASLGSRYPDLHDREHVVIECLAEALWDAQSRNELPDDARYIERLRSI